MRADTYAHILSLGQIHLRHLSFSPEELCPVLLPRKSRDEKCASSSVLRLCLCHHLSLAVFHDQTSVSVLAFLAHSLKGKPLLHPVHPVSALGIDSHLSTRLFLPQLVIAPQGAQGHHLTVVSSLLGLVIHGEHTAVELVIITIELPCHLLSQEPGIDSLLPWMLMLSPVELPARIGSQFIIAGIGRIGKAERAAAHAVSQAQRLPFHQVAILVEEFGIKHTTDVRGRHLAVSEHIRLVPDGVTQEVAVVVHVYRHYLLRCVPCVCNHLAGQRPQRIIGQFTLHGRKLAREADCLSKALPCAYKQQKKQYTRRHHSSTLYPTIRLQQASITITPILLEAFLHIPKGIKRASFVSQSDV